MTELLNVLKTSIPVAIFFGVAAAFALFFLVLVFFYIAKEKKPLGGFDVTATVLNIAALIISVLLGVCAIFYAYPNGKISIEGSPDAYFNAFGYAFVIRGLGEILGFIVSKWGIALFSVLLFALILFAIVHPLRIARKKRSAAQSQPEEKFSDLTEHEPQEGVKEEPVSSAADDSDLLLDGLSEENLSDKIDEIVTKAKIDVSAADDVSPYILTENDVSDVLDILSTEEEQESSFVGDADLSVPLSDEQPAEQPADEQPAEQPADEISDEQPVDEQPVVAETEPEQSEEPDEQPENLAAETEPAPEKTEKPAQKKHASDFVIPVTVRTITRRSGEPEQEPPKKPAAKKPAAEKTAEKQKPQTKKTETPESQAKKTGTRGVETQKTQKPQTPKTQTRGVETQKPETQKPQTQKIETRGVETREVEAKHVSGLPVNRRYVVQNRRNVVNMFNDYLNSKDKEEKEKLANSLNTIILK